MGNFFVSSFDSIFSKVETFGKTIAGRNHDSSPGLLFKGFGESEELPDGDEFELPDGVFYFAPIKGYNPSAPGTCGCVSASSGKGLGDSVRICLPLENSTQNRVTVRLPAGLIFVSKNLDVQNGILVEEVDIEIPPMGFMYIPLFLNCINAGRSFYASLDDEFVQGKVTTEKPVCELLELLAGKDLHADPLLSQYIEAALKDIAYHGAILDETAAVLRGVLCSIRAEVGSSSLNNVL